MSDLLKVHGHLLVFDKAQFADSADFESADKATLGVLSAKYDQILNHPALKPLFDLEWSTSSTTTYSKLVSKAVAEIKVDNEESEEFSSLLILAAVSALHLFVQANFTGPALELDPFETTIKGSSDESEIKAFQEHCVESLTVDGEPAYTLSSYPHLLILSNEVLKAQIGASQPLNLIAKWWYARTVLIHQSIVNGAASSLHLAIFENFTTNLLQSIVGELDNADLISALNARYYAELARIQLQYDYDTKAEHSLKLAQHSTELQYILTGYKAKRTKYQQFETSQMIFLSKSKVDKRVKAVESAEGAAPPTTHDLNSDLLLEQVKYSGSNSDNSDYATIPEALKSVDPNKQPALQDIDTCIILLRQSHIKSSSPFNNPLVQEELLAIANRVINSPSLSVNWCLYSRALWERSLLEAQSPKTVERGTLQMQSLVEELGQSTTGTFIPKQKPTDESGNISERLSYVHQVLPLPKWAMDAKLAERFMAIGILKSALEVYERLEMWDQVALCYAAVGQEEKGQEVLEDHLKKHPKDARSWTILGEITENPEYFEKSWEVGRYPAARRMLGRYYYTPPKAAKIERDIGKVIEYLNEALTVNPLHYNTWFLYGCAGLETEQYDLAAEAFTRCVALDETDGKSWSNLSTSLLRMGKKSEAFNALKRAVRVTSEKKNWRIWSNYVTVAVDLGEWHDVLLGTKELLTIDSEKTEGALDVGILERLCQILVSTNYPETIGDDEDATPKLDFFQKSALELFAVTLPSLITTKARLWKIVSKVELWRNRPWAALEAFEKGFRIYTHLPEVETDEKVWDEAVEYCSDLVDAYVNLGPREGRHGDGSVVCSNWKFKAKSAVRILVGRGKKWWEDSQGWERLQEIKEEI